MTKRDQFIKVFDKYVPLAFSAMLADILLESKVRFKVVKSRKTKLGDFRTGDSLKLPIITVNADLNPFSFLVTSLHEFAHYHTYQKYGNKVLPHGIEWKTAFRLLLLPVINSGDLPKDIESALLASMVNTKASSCSDINLSRVLYRYNAPTTALRLEEIPKNTNFSLNNRNFVKLSKRRTRYECQEISSGKMFLVHAMAVINKIQTNGE